jgi:hypothetical protein
MSQCIVDIDSRYQSIENLASNCKFHLDDMYRIYTYLSNEFGSPNISLSRPVKVLYYLKFLFKAIIIK